MTHMCALRLTRDVWRTARDGLGRVDELSNRVDNSSMRLQRPSRQGHRHPQKLSPSLMLWGLSSLATVLLNSAARALPQGDLGDLLPLGAEFDEPVPVPTQTTRRTEQASTLPRVEHTTSAFPQPITHTVQLTTTIFGFSSYPHLTPTKSPTSLLPGPISEGNDTHTSVVPTSASQNIASSTWYPSSPPVADSDLPQGQPVDWHVIGIAVIAISVVGTMILIIVFFDQWWGFLCDVCGRRRKRQGGGKEELVPDWERGTWEFKIEDNNLPAYPSFGSPPALRMQNGVTTHVQPWKVDADQRPNQNMSPDCLAFLTTRTHKDNSQVLSTQGVPYGPSGRHQQSSPSSVVNEVTACKVHSPLGRSDTQKSTASEDAYDGLAA